MRKRLSSLGATFTVAIALAVTGCSDDGSAGTPQGDASGDTGADDTGGGTDAADDTGGADAAGDSGGGDTLDDAGDTGEDSTGDATGDAGGDALDDAGGDIGGDIGEDTGGDIGGDIGEDTGGDIGEDTGGDTDPGLPEGDLASELWGRRLWAPVMGVNVIGRELWFGTMGAYALPEFDGQQTDMRGGIGRLDLDTGAISIIEEELPQFTYVIDPNGTFNEYGPMPTAESIDDGASVLTVGYTGVVEISGKSVSFHELVPADGLPMEVRAMALDRGGDRNVLWVGTNHGLYQLDPDTFEVTLLWGEAELGSADVGRLAVDPATGAVYAVVYDFDSGHRIARLEGDQVAWLEPDDGVIPAGMPQDIVFSAKHATAYISLASYAPTTGGVVSWDGIAKDVIAVEGQLAKAGSGEDAAFGASRLALAEDDDVLVVGGSLMSSFGGGIKGGGIAWVHLPDKTIAGLQGGKHELPGTHVVALTVDPVTNRTYASLRQPCNESQLGNVGIIAISFRDDGSARYEKPILSGVRSLVMNDGEVYAALRDDNPGFSCDGLNINTGIVKLRSNRSGELVPLQTIIGDEIVPYPGATDLEVTDAGSFAIGTWKAGTFWGPLQAGGSMNQAFHQTSLHTHDVEWKSSNQLWISGTATHSLGDAPELADKGPRGALLVTFGEDGMPAETVHYVRESEDAKDITGLPSANVMDVLAMDDGTTWFACAAERYDVSYLDRIEGKVFVLKGIKREGGIARVLPDGTIDVVADSKIAPDPRALAVADDGAILALDSEHGVIRIADGVATQSSLPFPLPVDDRRAHGLLLVEETIVASLWEGAAVMLAGEWQMFDDVGHAWEAMERAAGVVLVGTDEGVLRVRADFAEDVAEPAIQVGSTPPFAVIDPPDNGGGLCLPKGAPCGLNDTCCDGLSCSGGIVLICQ